MDIHVYTPICTCILTCMHVKLIGVYIHVPMGIDLLAYQSTRAKVYTLIERKSSRQKNILKSEGQKSMIVN